MTADREKTMTITEFLEARIAEDEAEAAEYQRYEDQVYETAGWFDPSRVLRECVAKRAILGRHEVMQAPYLPDYCSICAEWDEAQMGEGPPNIPFPCDTLKILAAIYSDHTGYQQEWAA